MSASERLAQAIHDRLASPEPINAGFLTAAGALLLGIDHPAVLGMAGEFPPSVADDPCDDNGGVDFSAETNERRFIASVSTGWYKERSGQLVTILRSLTDEERDPEVGTMYRVRFADGKEGDVFADELRPA